MIELVRHIEYLLLENDCVIIPDFGGFIAHYQPARYVEEEHLFLPPTRTIGFNPQLTLNDGLLAQAYMQAHHTDFPDATRMIAREVAELKDILHKEGCAEMHGIGTLHYNIYGTYEFHPNEDGALSPSLYGLGAFTIKRLEPSDVTPIVKTLLPKPLKARKIYRIGRKWAGNVAAVAVAIILFFFLSVPVENTYVDKGNYASLGTDGLFDAIRSQSLATTLLTIPQDPQKRKHENREKHNQNTLKPVTVKVEKVTKSDDTHNAKADTVATTKQPKEVAPKRAETAPVETEKKTAPANSTPATPIAKKDNYCIIVSSLATAKDAEQVLSDYKKKGYKDAAIVEGNGRYRLSLCSFADKAAAYKKLNELKKDEAFKNAWVLNAK